MTKEELKEFALKNKDNFSIQLKRHHSDIFELIDKQYDFQKFGEKLYVYINGESSIRKCKICGKKTEFEGYWKGYPRLYCSCKCRSGDASDIAHEIRICIICGGNFRAKRTKPKKICSYTCRLKHNASEESAKIRLQATRRSMMEKYGVEYALKSPIFKEKFKRTKLEKYGDENYNNIDKAKQTKLEKYGDENYNNRDEFKLTMVNKYGVEWAMQSKELQERSRQTFVEKYGGIGLASDVIKKKIGLTMIQKYGVGSPLKNEDIKKRHRATWMERYGGYTLASPTLREKVMATILLKYNVENVSQISEVKDKVREYYRTKMVKNIFFGDRLHKVVTPLFRQEEYINSTSDNRYPFECNACHSTFSDHLYSAHIPRCPICYPSSISMPQGEVFEYIKSVLPIGTEIQQNVRSPINPLELDLYIPSLKLAIEYNGLYWHGEANGGKSRRYHLNKTMECEKNGIRLIHIFEDEWFDKQYIIKSRLKHLLNCNKEKIYARKCEVKVIDYDKCYEFLIKYHLQGSDRAPIRLGLYYNTELVSVMTFGCNRIALGNTKVDDEYEMYRFCVGDRTVVGAGSKLLTYFIKNYHPLKITSYADRRYSFISAFYLKIGFKLISTTNPNYWYFDKKTGVRYHRYSFRKSELPKKLEKFDINLTEWQNMQLNGYDRIWDCGNYKYEWKSAADI